MTVRNMIIDTVLHEPGLNNNQIAEAIHSLPEGKEYSYETIFRELRRLSSESSIAQKRLRVVKGRYFLEDDAKKSTHLENWV